MKDGVCDALVLITLHPWFLLNKLKSIPSTPTSKKKNDIAIQLEDQNLNTSEEQLTRKLSS